MFYAWFLGFCRQGSVEMSINEVELEGQLVEAGNKLLNPPSSVDELLALLDNVGSLLINVKQAPSRSMQDALLLPMKALISSALLRHANADVKLSVASCISEITRITAPDAPYNDEQMKEIFLLIVASFEKLSHVSGRSYLKAVSILETVAKVRSCLVMLDLQLDELIIVMFQHFLKFIRSNHPHNVILAMETIMTLVIVESEDVSVDLLAPLLASVRRQTQNVSPTGWKLGVKVMTNCSAKLKPYLKEAVKFVDIPFDEYAPIVASICQDDSHALKGDHIHDPKEYLITNSRSLSQVAAFPGETFQEEDVGAKSAASNRNVSARKAGTIMDNSSLKTMEHCSLIGSSGVQGNAEIDVRQEKEQQTVPRRRGWKPNSLMNPQEGYYRSGICTERKTSGFRQARKTPDKEIDDSTENPVSNKLSLSSANINVAEPVGNALKTGLGLTSLSPELSLRSGSHTKRGRPKKKGSIINQDGDFSLARREIFRTHVEEKAPPSDHAGLRKQPKERLKSEAKQQNRPRKIGFTGKTAKEGSPFSGNVAFKMKKILSGPEGKPSHQLVKRERDNLLVEEDTKKRSKGNGIPDKGVAEASNKKTNSSNDDIYLEETTKPQLKRKCTLRKDVAPETPDLDETLIGSGIMVWWPIDRTFYEGVVDLYDPIKKKHRVLYADGDVETLNLKRERWQLIEDDTLTDREGKSTGFPNVDASSNVPQRVKGKKRAESPKKVKANSTSKRSGAESISRKKARKSGGRSADAAAHSKPIAVDKPNENNKSKPDGFSDENVNKSSGKLKIKVPRIHIDSMQAPPGFRTPYIDEIPKVDFCDIDTEQSPPVSAIPFDVGHAKVDEFRGIGILKEEPFELPGER